MVSERELRDSLLEDEKREPRPGWEPYYVAKGINLSTIARGIGMSLPGVSRIFAGTRTPKLASLYKICHFLNAATGTKRYTVDYLLELIQRKPWIKKARAAQRKSEERLASRRSSVPPVAR